MSGKPAARITDPTLCPLPGHGVTPIVAGSADVLFDGLSATRQGDPAACGGVMVGNLATTVFINGRNAATVGSIGSHGNLVISGSGSVIIGDSHTPAPFLKPALLLQLKTYAMSFFITDSESGEPIASREFVALVDGVQHAGFTDTNGIAFIEAPSEDSEIILHVKFRSPARILDEMGED